MDRLDRGFDDDDRRPVDEVAEAAARRRERLRRVWRFCRYSFAFRAVLTMCLGVLASCGNCTTCLAFATYIGCNSCSDSSSGSSSGCDMFGCSSGDSDDDDEEELPETETSCQDGVDDDGDGEIDCEDADCRFAGLCGEYICYDGRDDDGDGLTDCDDDDCCHLRQCRCQCETRCESGSTLCIADDESCDAECCPVGEECVEGRCTDCSAECAAGYVPCWTGEGPCGHVCCTPGQGCDTGVCGCETDCGPGTRACITDEWACEYQCCAEGDVCRAGGCEPYSCTGVVDVEDAAFTLDLAWNDLEDTVDVGGLEGCTDGGGAEAILRVDVAPGEALTVVVDEGQVRAGHVVPACPPEGCQASVSDLPEQALLWINEGAVAEQVMVLLEGDGDRARGSLILSRDTGAACAAAIPVTPAADTLGWTADSSIFARWDETGLCETTPQRRIWFEVEVDAGARLDVTAWGGGAGLYPSLAVTDGDCAEPTCLALGAESVSFANEGADPRVFLVAFGWSADFEGALNVDFRVE